MANVMISYSRTNRDVAFRLDEELQAAGQEVWIDREIEPAADWKQRIAKAIDECSTVVFLVSPDSLTSSVCDWEVEHALGDGKRIVPVVVAEPQDTPVPLAISSRNYVFMDNDEQWQPGLLELITAIEVDLAWADFHARILVRALEWDSAGRTSRAMLRGQDLKEAEHQFSISRKVAESQPTALQLQYLQACRADASKRQRRLIGAGAIALAAIAALAVVALVLGQRAADERDRANDQAAISRAGELAALSNSTSDPYEAAVLAIEADQGRATTATRDALVRAAERLDALPANRRFGRLLGHENFVWAVDVSAGANRVASAGLDGTVLTWDLVSGEAIDATYLLGNAPVALEFSSNGELLAIVDDAGWIHLLNPADLTPVQEPGQLSVAGASLRFFENDTIVVVGSTEGFEVWDIETSRSVNFIDFEPIEGLWSVDISPDRTLIAGGTITGDVAIWDAATGQLRTAPTAVHNEVIYSVAWSPDSSTIATTSLDRALGLIDATTGKPMPLSNGHEEGVLWVDWSPDGSRLVSTGFDGTVRLWNAVDGSPFGDVLRPHTNSTSMVTWADDADVVASASDDLSVMVWDVESVEAVTGSFGTDVGVREVRWAGDSFWAADDWGVLVNYGSSGNMLQEIFVGDAPVVSMDLTLDGTRVAALDQSGVLVVANVDGSNPSEAALGSEVEDFAIDRVRPGSVAWSPDNTTLAVGLDDGVWLWAPGDAPTRLATPISGWTFAIAWSPDGALLAVGGEDDLVHVWDVDADVAAVEPLADHIDDVYDIAWSPDGTMLASGSKDKLVRLWATETWEPSGIVLQGHRGWVLDVSWSPDGTTIATSSPDRTVRLWDAGTGASLGDPLEGFTGFVTSVDWNGDGGQLVAADDLGNIRTFQTITPAELCEWAIRGLGEAGLSNVDIGDTERTCSPTRQPTDTALPLPPAVRILAR